MFKYLNISIVFLIFSLIIYIIYRAIIIPDNFLYYLKFIIFLLAIKITIIYFIIIKKKFFKEFSLFFFSIIFSIYLIEIMSYLYLRTTQHDYYKEDLFNYYKINKNKNDNLTIFYRNFVKDINGDTIFPLSGLANKETVLCNENGYFSQYLSDRYGFRNDDNLWDMDLDWVLLGDSFVHGSCVNNNQTIHHHLKNGLGQKILNLGIVGHNGYDQLGAYKEYLDDKNPKNIMWFYFEGNDFRVSDNNKHHKITKKYLMQNFSQNLKNNNKYINRNLEIEFSNKFGDYEKKRKNAILKLVNVRLILNQILPALNFVRNKPHLIYKSQPTAQDIIQLKKIIIKIKNLTKKNNQKLYFVYLPSFQRYHNKERTSDETYYNRNEILNILEDGGYNVIDIHKEFFSDLINPLEYFPYKDRKGHYTPDGYKAVSTIIVKEIINNGNHK